MFTRNAVNLFPKLAPILDIDTSCRTVCYKDNPLSCKERFWRCVRSLISKIYDRIFA